MTIRRIELVRGGWGAAMLFAPRLVLSRVHRVDIDRKSLVIARVLGARQLAQAVLSGADPSPEVLAMGVWVDTAHAASAVGLAVADAARRRAGITDMLVAGTWAAAGYRDLHHASATSARHDRMRDALARRVLRIVPAGRHLNQLAAQDRRVSR